jgi:hypothetical protein
VLYCSRNQCECACKQVLRAPCLGAFLVTPGLSRKNGKGRCILGKIDLGESSRTEQLKQHIRVHSITVSPPW